MTLWSLCRRLFAPIANIKTVYIKWLLSSASFFLFDIYTVRIFKTIWDDIQANNIAGLKQTVILYIILFVAFYIRKYRTRHRGRAKSKPAVVKELWSYSLKKFFSLDPIAVEKMWTWRSAHVLETWNHHRSETLLQFQYQGVELLIKGTFSLYLVFLLGPFYGIGFILFVLWGAIIMSFLNNKAIVARKLRKEEEVHFSRSFIRLIMSKWEVLLSNKQAHEITQIESTYDNIWKYNVDVNEFLFLMFNIPLLVVQWFTWVILIHTYYSLNQWTFDLWVFTSLVSMTGYLIPLMLTSTNTFKVMTDSFVHVQKLWNFFDTSDVMTWYDTGKEFVFGQWNIEFDAITFGYQQETSLDTTTKNHVDQHSQNSQSGQVFQNFSLTIQWWKKTALVWMSWSWKTTLIKLIAGYMQVDWWEVRIDGQAMQDVSLRSYFGHIWYLTQEPSIFDWSIRENLVYGLQDDIDVQTIAEAIQLAKCEFVYDFADWLETQIGERGVRLSWWQRQRLAIAKIFLKNPQIILLDEPTSALDSFSEEAITEAMHTLFAGRTVIIVAHRLQTVKQADEILLFWKNPSDVDGGSIILERWTHDELVALGWAYAKMLALQAGF